MIIRFAVAILCVVLAAPAWAAPKSELWDRWLAHDPASTRTIDHSAWGRFLDRYRMDHEDGVARVAYGAVTAQDRADLDAYLARLSGTPIDSFSRPEQQAFWFNLYNALTIKVILDHHPVDSIRDIDISPGLFSSGPWGKALITVAGEDLTLDDIEHRILRPIWQDPRVHYGVNCASIGCPNLAPEAFTAANTDALLEAGAKAFVNHPRAAKVERGRLTVSSIYIWFQTDFGRSDSGVIEHLKQYAEPELSRALASVNRINGHRYDWDLNDAPTPGGS